MSLPKTALIAELPRMKAKSVVLEQYNLVTLADVLALTEQQIQTMRIPGVGLSNLHALVSKHVAKDHDGSDSAEEEKKKKEKKKKEKIVEPQMEENATEQTPDQNVPLDLEKKDDPLLKMFRSSSCKEAGLIWLIAWFEIGYWFILCSACSCSLKLHKLMTPCSTH